MLIGNNPTQSTSFIRHHLHPPCNNHRRTPSDPPYPSSSFHRMRHTHHLHSNRQPPSSRTKKHHDYRLDAKQIAIETVDQKLGILNNTSRSLKIQTSALSFTSSSASSSGTCSSTSHCLSSCSLEEEEDDDDNSTQKIVVSDDASSSSKV
ncbi:hypothetical protein L2E82_16775 [Cichorium intybus]|uniref:Uncharacterized protein n=1 Tax=Cichorium intybus TaxID=13427 RepID=A0ACB9F706_CICIN|nr:hypothetical protein L2E82_16775 [Cichorium intybus]